MSLVPRETSGGFFDPKQDAEAKRRRRLAQQMMKAGEQPTSTEMVSGMAVKQSPLAALARAVQTGIGSYQENRADQIDAEAAKRRQEMIAQAVKQYGSNPQGTAEMLAQDPATSDAALKILSDIPAQGSMFSGNSIQAQIGNQMKAQGYSDQQILQALTMQGIPLQDGGYGVYSKVDRVGAPGGVPSGTPSPNPAPVQTSELPASGGAPFNDIMASLQGKPTGMDGQAPASAPVPNPPTPQQMANQAQSRFGGVDVLVQPGMKQADILDRTAQANKAEIQASTSIGLIDKLIDERGNLRPEAASVVGPIQGRTVANMPMTRNQTYAQPIIDQLRGQTFLQAFETLKGGGAITEIEGQKAEQAIARLSQTQYEPDFAQALKELRDIMAVGMERAQQMRGQIRTANPVQNQMPAAPQNVQPNAGASGGWSIEEVR